MRLPLFIVDCLFRIGIFSRPSFLIQTVSEAPFEHEMKPTVIYDEVRGGHRKWLHLLCPKCREPIQLEAAGQPESWELHIDWLCRPTVFPSIWETQSCGAHFFVRAGKIVTVRSVE